MSAYYNEHDPFAAAWLRELIKAGHIADGEVDERSIEDVLPTELAGFTQCHFFAGIGGWSLALRLAGWPDDRPVWTGSCPCQPFSTAGKGGGTSDERHLWPAWFHLISQCNPDVVFGEQVEEAIRHGWLDLVQADMEGIGYAFGAVGLPAASVGAPHIRQRLWFVADSDGEQEHAATTGRLHAESGERGNTGIVENACGEEQRGRMESQSRNYAKENGQRTNDRLVGSGLLAVGELGNSDSTRPQGYWRFEQQHDAARREREERLYRTAGFWDNAEWLPCWDGKSRPVEPTIFPLAHGVSSRVGLLRGAGNAIVPQVAKAFIESYLER